MEGRLEREVSRQKEGGREREREIFGGKQRKRGDREGKTRKKGHLYSDILEEKAENV